MYTYNDASVFAALMAFIAAYSIVLLIIAVVLIIANWKIFSKAGEPGWAAIVPFYSQYVLFKITLGQGWLFLLGFVPVIGVVMYIIVIFKLASAFGKGIGFGFGLLFLLPIFFMILAFGSSEYIGA